MHEKSTVGDVDHGLIKLISLIDIKVSPQAGLVIALALSICYVEVHLTRDTCDNDVISVVPRPLLDEFLFLFAEVKHHEHLLP